jgi:hypothetical protein
MADCLNAAHDGVRVNLTLRYVTRLYPDAASPAGLENRVQTISGNTDYVPMSGQVVAFFDVPTTITGNPWGSTCTTGSPAPLCLQRFDYNLYVGIQPPTGSPDTSTFGASQRPVRLQRGSGVPSDNTVYSGFTTADMARFVPFPKLVMKVDPTTESASSMYAADIKVTYPSNVTIKDVIEEENLGRHSLVSWQSSGTNQITIQLISPKHDVNRVSVVFSLTNTTPVTVAGFTIDQSTLYDVNGNPMSGRSFLKDIIR